MTAPEPSAAKESTGIVSGLRGLAPHYDALILDLWGVLHDGLRPYPWVIPCLQSLRDAGKKLCVLSNAPRRVSRIAAHMAEIGLAPVRIDAIYSSGEATYEALTGCFEASPLTFPLRRCLHIGAADDAGLALGADIRLTDDPAEADFVLCTGVGSVDDRLEDYQGILQACLRHKLPLVCANPDLEVMHGDRIKLCAGALAAFYEGEGGLVVSYGKPYRPVYDRCLGILATPREHVLAVGDSFRTDVAGAAAAAIDCLLIGSGLEAESLLAPDDSVDAAALERVAAEWKLWPRWTTARFVW